MSKFYAKVLLGLSFFLFAGFFSYAQVSVTASAGTAGPTAYTTLKAAFDRINDGTHRGNVTVSITGNTTETATAALNANAAPASYTSITISNTGAFTVTANLASPLINLNGASNVTINGNNTLQLVNTSATGNVLSFNADANTNIIRNTIIKGATNVTNQGFPTAGVIMFGNGLTTGNDNNTIENCDVDGTNAASCLLISTNTSTTAAGENSGNTVRNSKFHDNINATTTTSMGFVLDEGNTGWTIEGNSFYHSANLSTAQQFVIRFLVVLPSFTSDAHTIRGNFIGGTSSGANGTLTLAASGTNALGFIGMDIESAGTGNLVENNVVRNITLTYNNPAGTFGNAAIFGFIGGFDGTSTFNNNTVSNLNFTNSSGFITLQGIHVNARVTAADETVIPAFTLTNNTITNITVNSGGTTGDVQLHGIRLETSSSSALTNTSIANPTFTVTGNTISNISVPFAGASTSPATFIRAIGTVNTQGGTNPNFSTALLQPKVDIRSNNIFSLSTSSGLSNYAAAVVVGVHFGGGSAGGVNSTDIQRISQNTISNLSATNNGDVGAVVAGISATTGVHDISRNRIFDLKNASTGAATNPGLVGISVRLAAATTEVTNNFISLGNGQTTNLSIFGIIQNFIGTGPVNISHNSVVITGAGAAGNNKTTVAVLRGTETLGNTITTPVNVRNNILSNLRTGGGSHFAIGNTLTTAPTGWTSSGNNLNVSNAANTALWGAAANNLATYLTNSGDPNSTAVTVNFVNANAGDLHLTGASLTDANLKAAAAAPGVTVDFDNETRSTTAPTKGGDEPSATCTAPAITTQPAAVSGCAGTNASFTVVATGTSLTYQWRKGGTAIPGATNASFTITSTVAGDAANYDVVITNSCGSATSNAVALTVNAATAITTQPTAVTTCAGTAASFTVAATGAGLTYQWRKNGTNIAGATNATFNIGTTVAGDAGSYSVVVTGTCGSVTSNAVNLTVQNCTSVPNIDEDLTAAVLMPNVANSSTILRVTARRAMKVEWNVTDAQGRIVMKMTQQLSAGRNDLTIQVSHLATGSYFIGGTTPRGNTAVLQLFKK